jgi:hypothetical protein
MIAEYCGRLGKPVRHYRALFYGDKIEKNDTAEHHDMMDGDGIVVHWGQYAGGGNLYSQSEISSFEAPAMGFGAGAQVHQIIRRDEQDPRSWDTRSAKLLNVQIFNTQVFEQLLGFPAPPTPITFADYTQANMPILQRFLEEKSSVYGNFNRIVSLQEAEDTDRSLPAPHPTMLLQRLLGEHLSFYEREEELRSIDKSHVALQDPDPRWKAFESVVDLASLKITEDGGAEALSISHVVTSSETC